MIIEYDRYIHIIKALGLKKEGNVVIDQRMRAWKYEDTITNTKQHTRILQCMVFIFSNCAGDLLTNGHGLWLAGFRDIKKPRNMQLALRLSIKRFAYSCSLSFRIAMVHELLPKRRSIKPCIYHSVLNTGTPL